MTARAPALMIQGTGSHVGKSLLVAGLCRAFARRGLRVRPFKPQNMSNNAGLARLSGETGFGENFGEIGRAQVLQAQAAGVPPSVDMNPVLLKPQGEKSAQVVVRGKVWRAASASEYRNLRAELLPRVLESFGRLEAEADVVVVEGAGSPAEVNLREGDIANMGFALPARVPVVLAGDIDRGGVLASLVGTWALLTPEERALVGGFVVNKFRGDPKLFADGPEVVTRETGLRSFGTVPYLAEAARLPAEDSVALDSTAPSFAAKREGKIRIAVPRLPRLSNFDDLDPLAAEPGVEIVVVPPGRALPRDADAIVIPGSKATLADLAALRAEGWDVDIAAHARAGGVVVGLCGGFQMLGTRVADPDGLEGPPAEAEGLGLLEVETVIGGEKTLRPARGKDSNGEEIAGYEMHMGETSGKGLARPWLALDGAKGEHERGDGAVSADGRIFGCYVHGLFSSDAFRRAFLARLGARTTAGESPPSSNVRREDSLATGEPFAARVESALDAIAAKLESSLDVDGLLALARSRV